jgi:hypothetical protein
MVIYLSLINGWISSIAIMKKGCASMSVENSVVSIFNTHPETEEAIKELQRSGFDIKKLSVVGK